MAKALAAYSARPLERLQAIRLQGIGLQGIGLQGIPLQGIRRIGAPLLVLLLALVGVLVAQPVPARAAESDTIYTLVNQSRAEAGLAPLQRNPAIDSVAVTWANQMAANNKMSHNPDFSTQIPGGWNFAGENVAQGQSSGSDVHIAWMNSAGHRANILGDFTDVGIAFISAGGTTWGVEVFGRYADHVGWAPAPAAAPAATPAAAEPAAPAPTPTATPAPPAPTPTATALAAAPRRSATAKPADPLVDSVPDPGAAAKPTASSIMPIAILSGQAALPAAAATGVGTMLGGLVTVGMILMRRARPVRPVGARAIPASRRRPAHRRER